MSENHGKFCWYELLTTDVAAAKSFYPALLGWGVQDVPMPGMAYAMWTKQGGTPIGGVTALPAEAKAMGAPPHWLLHIAVDDLEAIVRQAGELGGAVLVPPTDIPGFGRFAVLSDPDGASFAIYKGNQEVALPSVDNDLGGVSWHELMTRDVDAALRFYGALFGWGESSRMDMGKDTGPYVLFGRGDQTYGGIMKKPAAVPMPSWLAYVTVADAAAAAGAIAEHGGQVLHGPVEVPGGGTIVAAMDPQGAAFAVYAHKA